MSKTILILGGYGNAGLFIAQYLLQETDANIILSGRNQDKAAKKAAELNAKYKTDRASARKADASDIGSLTSALQGVDFIVAASSTIDYAENTAKAAIAAGVDYLDVQLSSKKKLTALQRFELKIKESGRIFITDGGFHPGLPAALIKYAAAQFDSLEKCNVSSIIQMNWKSFEFSSATAPELAHELLDFDMSVFKNGVWEKAGYKESRKFDFGKNYGQKYCVPWLMEELKYIPKQINGLKETGFYVSGFNWFTDYAVMPMCMIGLKYMPNLTAKPLINLLVWSLRTFSKPPYYVVLQAEAEGVKDGNKKKMVIRTIHDDGYAFTAIPAVACIKQYLDGKITEPGLYFQGVIMEPNQMMEDMKKMGVRLEIE